MKRVIGSLIVAAALWGAQARADEGADGPWYGWQLMAADAAAVALLFVPVSADAGPVTRGAGFTLLFMNAPILHMVNANPRSASISLLRLPALLLGQAIATGIAELACSDVDCVNLWPTVGAAVGIAPVVLHDWWTARPRPLLFSSVPRAPAMPPPRAGGGRLAVERGWALRVPLAAVTF